VLPAAARLTSSQEFGSVVRRGRRAGRPRLVVHALMAPTDQDTAVFDSSGNPSAPTRNQPVATRSTRVGFVVSKAVGNSVVRHRVSRRLRHLMRDRLGTLPTGCSLVVRALPAAAVASSAELGVDLDAALRRLSR
jgi:ribonuclease P protein component